MASSSSVVEWLLDSDPAIRWQVLRDVVGAPVGQWAEERAKVETEGLGAQLLSWQDDDGQWAGGAFAPKGFDWSQFEEFGQPWTATTWSLTQLREFGFEPSSQRARETVRLIGEHSRWDHAGQPFWDGEVEECINGRTMADGAYFGVDVAAIVERLLGERLSDGGWNCERCNGSLRSSFATTINVLEGLLEYERVTGGTAASRIARESGEMYLLVRHLYRRLSTGELADEQFVSFTYPTRWRYDVLRALDYFRAAAQLSGTMPDSRLGPAIELLRSKRSHDGRWLLDWTIEGAHWLSLDAGVGLPSRWITLRALRVLNWWDEQR